MFEDAMNFRFVQEEIQIFSDRKVFSRKELKVRDDIGGHRFLCDLRDSSRSLRLKSFTCGCTILVVRQTREEIIVSLTFAFLCPVIHSTPARTN
jgi:hypothetical protein